MHLTESSLRDPAGRAARAAALELLAKVRANRDRLDDAADGEALHDFRVSVRRLRSWLRAYDSVVADTLPRKVTRRLHRIAGATGASRDLEVHLAWAEERRRTLRGDLRRGADWLIGHLAKRKAASDLDLRRTVDAEFDRAAKRVETAMSKYTALVVGSEPPFAAVAARLVRRHASALAKALRSVSSMGDRAEAHEARIAAKRLRYLLDPLDRALPNVGAIVDALGEMQDRLGELHDAQLFGSEIATIVAERLADRVKSRPVSGDWQPSAAEALLAREHDDPVPGLLAFARRLRRAEEVAFGAIRESWLNDHAAALLARVEEIAMALDAIARQGRRIHRTYLLQSVPVDMPSETVVTETDAGFLPGNRLDERIIRATTDGETQYRRLVGLGSDAQRIEVEDELAARAFRAMWPLTKGQRLRTRTWRVETNDQSWVVQEFLDRDMVLAAIEFDGDESAPVPPWIEAVMDRDVTDDPAYGDRALAR